MRRRRRRARPRRGRRGVRPARSRPRVCGTSPVSDADQAGPLICSRTRAAAQTAVDLPPRLTTSSRRFAVLRTRKFPLLVLPFAISCPGPERLLRTGAGRATAPGHRAGPGGRSGQRPEPVAAHPRGERPRPGGAEARSHRLRRTGGCGRAGWPSRRVRGAAGWPGRATDHQPRRRLAGGRRAARGPRSGVCRRWIVAGGGGRRGRPVADRLRQQRGHQARDRAVRLVARPSCPMGRSSPSGCRRSRHRPGLGR